ncbi:MAG TPA: YraN family protein [Acidimicrobiales bacterium]|nr:YraN family protein [Acidimicrobiales bacterium]
MTHARRALGVSGEEAVAAWYLERGYRVLDRNWRCRSGELDLVARKGGLVVFCEVKTRSSDAFGLPAEAVNRQKQQRIRALAARWLDESPSPASEIRFDVACVLGAQIEVIQAAF